MRSRFYFALLLGLLFFFSCRKENDNAGAAPLRPALPLTPYDYESGTLFPAHFNQPPLTFINSTPAYNQVTDEGATLGRVLFYERQLSRNGMVSCGSCHSQERGFGDPRPLSLGFEGGLTGRHAMAIGNVRFSGRFFWDLRASGVENQVSMPLYNEVEMGMDSALLVTRVRQQGYYRALFTDAFGDTAVTEQRIRYALAQFIRAMTTFSSKYDEGVQNNFAAYSQLERDGKDFFFSGEFNCNHCHTTQNFYTTQALNNGLDAAPADSGFAAVSGDPADMGKFKVPTLRNIAVSAPYMHDGRFSTLEDVIEHYNSRIAADPNLDDRLTVEGMTGGTPKRYNMTAYQKAALVAFLKTLTDENFLHDPKFSDPFAH